MRTLAPLLVAVALATALFHSPPTPPVLAADPAPAATIPASRLSACHAVGEMRVRPSALLLGETAEIALHAEVVCDRSLHLVLVIDGTTH